MGKTRHRPNKRTKVNKYREFSRVQERHIRKDGRKVHKCASKIRFSTMNGAQAAVQKQPDKPLAAYHCPMCQGYHLTTKREQ